MGKRKLEFSTPTKSKVQKLTAFGFRSNSSDPEPTIPVHSKIRECATPSKTPVHSKISECATPKTPSSRKFMDAWGRPWLRYDVKLKLLFCDLCISAQVVNVFTTGCDIMKKESVTKHESRKSRKLFLYKYLWE